MDGLVELDKLSMVVVVDNESDGLSQPCKAADPSQKAADRAGDQRVGLQILICLISDGVLVNGFMD